MSNALKTQADIVNAAARKVASFGTKAYISDVAAELGYRTKAFNLGLLELNRLGLVKLTRADLVQALDSDKVAASETVVELSGMKVAEFHFIQG